MALMGFAIPLLAYALLAGAILLISLNQLNGQLFYSLDDTYIHMSIAKNWIEHGVWGFTQYAFSSTTSSPLWTFLIAAIYAITGTSSLVPIALSFITGAVAVLLFQYQTKKWLSPLPSILLGLAFILFTPIVPLSLLGMEHILHIALTLIFVSKSVDYLSDSTSPQSKDLILLLSLAAILPIVRLESTFVILLVGLLFLIQKNIKMFIFIGIVSAIPLILYGLYAWSYGWYPVPNSIILKSHTPEASGLIGVIYTYLVKLGPTLTSVPHLSLLFLLNALSVYHFFPSQSDPDPKRNKVALASFIFLSITIAHLLFSKTGWFYRYEAYLVGLGFMTLIPLIAVTISTIQCKLQRAELGPETNRIHQKSTIVGLLIVVFLISSPLIYRGRYALTDTYKAMHDRYLEHYQPALLVKRYYDNDTIAVNDIGILAFYTNAHILDVYGLGNMEPLRYAEDGKYTQSDLWEWAESEDTKIAILQIGWPEIKKRIPDQWIKVATWTIPRNVVFPDKQVGFYGTNTKNADQLRQHLIAFNKDLPGQIKVDMD